MQHIIKQILRETVERYNALSTKYGIPAEVLLQLVQTDPTSKVEGGEVHYVGPYVNWIIKQYRKDESFLQKADKVQYALKLFDRFKNKLSTKDINQVKSAEDLIVMVSALDVDRDLAHQTKAQHREQVMEKDVEIIYDSENWLLVTPKTKEASIAVAGPPLTRWCTSCIGDETSPNLFDTYHRMNELIIFCNKKAIIETGKGKGRPRPMFQFHVFEAHQPKEQFKVVGHEFQDINKKPYPLTDFIRVFPEMKRWFALYFQDCAERFLTEEKEFDYFYDKFFNPVFKTPFIDIY